MKLVTLYTTNNATKAHILCNRLNEHGIAALVAGDATSSLGLPSLQRIEIVSPEEQSERARQLLTDWSETVHPATRDIGRTIGLVGILGATLIVPLIALRLYHEGQLSPWAALVIAAMTLLACFGLLRRRASGAA